MPDWARPLLSFLSYAAFGTMGLLTVLLARPANRDEDLAVGTATGVVAGIMAFTLGSYAWIVVLNTALIPSLGVATPPVTASDGRTRP